MLKSKVGYSTNEDERLQGVEAATDSTKSLENIALNILFLSCRNDAKKVLKGVREVTNTPIIGCTSCEGIITPDGYLTSENGYVGMLSLSDKDMVVGVAAHEGGKDARLIGRKVAIEAVENAKSTRAPAYFYMIASPKEEEAYLMGIQDVIGRVPMFGGSAADNTVNNEWKIICNDKVISDGVAVAFFYTDNEIETTFTGAYKETDNMGLITEVKDHRNLVSIDGISALKKYAQWSEVSPKTLRGETLLMDSVKKPLGIKDPLGNLTVIRHPMYGEDNGTATINDDTIMLGNNVVEGTAIIQLEATDNEIINAPADALREVKKKMYVEPAAYILIHDGARKMYLKDKIEEVANQVIKEAKGVPFIMPFTFGEYGYGEHSSNICGGLMLSFTAIGKN
ncbi:MAG: FIST C-terminal domain-containing protein [Bacilli bacterium]|nr:FIST C-terminal domain-containing protein [Bacilli bacterium]